MRLGRRTARCEGERRGRRLGRRFFFLFCWGVKQSLFRLLVPLLLELLLRSSTTELKGFGRRWEHRRRHCIRTHSPPLSWYRRWGRCSTRMSMMMMRSSACTSTWRRVRLAVGQNLLDQLTIPTATFHDQLDRVERQVELFGVLAALGHCKPNHSWRSSSRGRVMLPIALV